MTARMVFSVVGLLAALAPSAQAQYNRPVTNPYQQPAFSPWLNLTRPGGSAFTNYYGFVRPQLDFASGLTQLGQQQALLQQNVANLDQATGQLITGTRSSFMTHRRYFMNNGSGGVGTGLGLGGGAGYAAGRGLGAGAGAQRGGMGGGAGLGGLGARGY
ncbi:MAG TPA: hypothetical protein VG013_12080 [Gemmataceae bacterium]|jgi:hypothetical protein|nr:hypothetical protein [Gemmataceae bacterium]